MEREAGSGPDGEPLGRGDISVGEISLDQARWYTLRMDRSVDIIAGKTYWIRLTGTYAASDDHAIHWVANSQNVLPAGQGRFARNGKWVDPDPLQHGKMDFLFKAGCP